MSINVPVLNNWAIFIFMDVVAQYLTFKIIYDQFTIKLATGEHFTDNKEQLQQSPKYFVFAVIKTKS